LKKKNKKKFKTFLKNSFCTHFKNECFLENSKKFLRKKAFFWTHKIMVFRHNMTQQIFTPCGFIIITFSCLQKNVKKLSTLFFNFSKKNKKEYFFVRNFKK